MRILEVLGINRIASARSRINPLFHKLSIELAAAIAVLGVVLAVRR
jgi:hypothetical protein